MKNCRLFGRLWFASILLVALLDLCAQEPGDKLWERALGVIDGSVAIDADGTIYGNTGSLDVAAGNKVFALNPDGTLRWEVLLESNLGASVTLGRDGFLYVGSHGPNATLYALARDGSQKWAFSAPDGINTTPAIGPDGTIYFGTGNTKTFFALNPDGTKKWQFDRVNQLPGGFGRIFDFGAAVGHDGTVYFGTSDTMFNVNWFYAVNPDGSMKWETPIGSAVTTEPAIDEDGTIYFGSNNATLRALNPDGSRKWDVAIGEYVWQSAPVIGVDGTIYIGSIAEENRAGHLHAINPDGTEKWDFPTTGVWSTPAVDRDGAIYFGDYDGTVYCLNPDGTKRWSMGTGRLFFCSPALTTEGAVLFGSSSGTLYAVHAGAPLASQSPWPKAFHDAQNSGQAGGKAALRIVSQPQKLSVAEGAEATFRVTAVSEFSLAYQWRFNGVNIPNATNAVFSLRTARQANAGVYDVAINSPHGSTVSAGARLTVSPASSFAQRILPAGYYAGAALLVRLKAVPPQSAGVYAVEDQPPAGWAVGALSDSGSYDAAKHKVKFGPFFDSTPRDLTYEITPPLLTLGSVNTFTGTGSVEGVGSAILGDAAIDLSSLLHPADSPTGDNVMSIDEVTAYASAWRRGELWPIAPNPIPIEYMTRAGALWKGGESYVCDPAVTDPALRWINKAPARFVSSHGLRIAVAQTVWASRELPRYYIPTEPFQVSIQVTPPETTTVYAVQEQVPADWTANPSGVNGVFDSVNHQMKWGPFFDHAARNLTYRVVPPSNASGSIEFTGIASFDGVNSTLSGSSQADASSRIAVIASRETKSFEVQVRGEIGARYSLEISADLVRWMPLASTVNSSGTVVLADPSPVRSEVRFYRVRKL